ncbi:hypothetical protein BDL97_04G069400 [Sphagnum fallax]|nr:hypothetical protein BDL97_04G069400 [Sphagnum fallax]KAH8964479.1 hypothetical protein BDL97_04G069400 [Sphagnum fallax]
MPEPDLSAVLEFCGINNNNHIASSSTSPTRCHDCPAARSLRTSSTFRLQICCKFVCKQTSPFETKDSNVNKGKNSSFAADSFLGVTGSVTVLNDVQDNCTNISGAQKRDEEEGQSTAPVQQGSTTTTRRSRNKECSSKYYGVRFRPDLNKWVAEIRVAEWKSVDKKVWLGTYISEQEAACAVDAARKILKCTKKKKPNFSSVRLEAYTESLPPELSLDNISDITIFKAITEFVKCKAKQYASEASRMGLPTTLPIVKEIQRTTFTPRVPMSNSQPAPAGDELTTSGTTVIQLAGSVNIEFPSISFEPLPYLDHGVNAIEVQMPMKNTSSPVHSHEYEQLRSPFHVTSAATSMGMADNFLKEEHHGKELNLEGYGVTPLLSSSMMFSQGASSLDWPPPQQPVPAAPIGSEVILHQEPFFMNVQDGLNVMLSHQLPEPNTYWPVDDQIVNLDFNYNETLGDSDVWVENYLGSCSEQYNDTIMSEGRETKLVPSFTMSSQGDGINSCMDAFLQGTVPANSHENSNQPT